MPAVSHSRLPSFAALSGALLLAAVTLSPSVVGAAGAGGASPNLGTSGNFARSAAGTRLTLFGPAGGDGQARATQALLGEADPLGCELGVGTTTFVLSLPQTETLRRFDFLNLTAAGRVSVAVSAVALPPESPRWRPVAGAGREFGTPDEVVACELGRVEARYVKITVETQAPGRIDTFGLFSTQETATATATAIETSGSLRRLVSYETLDAGRAEDRSRVVRVSSGGGQPARIVDGSLGTGHVFASGDSRPTTVLDLGVRRSLTRVSVACRTAVSGRFDFYLLPEHTSTEQAAAFSPDGRTASVATVRVTARAGLNRMTVPLNAEVGRYLAVVFVPGDGGDRGGHAPTLSDPKDFKNYRDGKDFAPSHGEDAAPPFSADLPSDSLPTATSGSPTTVNPANGSFVLVEVTPFGPVSPTSDFAAVKPLLTPGSAISTIAPPTGGSSLQIVPILPPPVGVNRITP